ncbi:hypothetical protein EBT31_08240, partial [bacterium]|nr:hypothetical protein [bacterium]
FPVSKLLPASLPICYLFLQPVLVALELGKLSAQRFYRVLELDHLLDSVRNRFAHSPFPPCKDSALGQTPKPFPENHFRQDVFALPKPLASIA